MATVRSFMSCWLVASESMAVHITACEALASDSMCRKVAASMSIALEESVWLELVPVCRVVVLLLYLPSYSVKVRLPSSFCSSFLFSSLPSSFFYREFLSIEFTEERLLMEGGASKESSMQESSGIAW